MKSPKANTDETGEFLRGSSLKVVTVCAFNNQILFLWFRVLGFALSGSFACFIIGDSTDQEFELSADMMIHDMDDETTLEEEELLEGKEEEISDELEELQKVRVFK